MHQRKPKLHVKTSLEAGSSLQQPSATLSFDQTVTRSRFYPRTDLPSPKISPMIKDSSTHVSPCENGLNIKETKLKNNSKLGQSVVSSPVKAALPRKKLKLPTEPDCVFLYDNNEKKIVFIIPDKQANNA